MDDAQWCDVPSLRFLLYLVQRIDELPIAVVAGVRTGGGGPQLKLTTRLGAHPLTQRLALEPLSGEAVAQLVRTSLDAQAGDAFCEACAAATGGNPLFLHTLVAGVRERGGDVDDAAAERVPDVGADALAHEVTARLEALPDGARELAQAVAVLGDGVALSQAAELTGLDEGAAEARLSSLIGAGILEHSAGVAFAHPILRAAVQSGIDPSLRATAHRRAARMLRAAGRTPSASPRTCSRAARALATRRRPSRCARRPSAPPHAARRTRPPATCARSPTARATETATAARTRR